MRYIPPPHLIARFHLVPSAFDSRPPQHRATVLVWDPRPLPDVPGKPSDPHGAVFGVFPGDRRHQAALYRVQREEFHG